ncbi:hypothetical protein FACS18947_0940 [Bacteroidia bacterium]|nr:hypothetical protein FACS18947_0940 [Bacteroidia bacterium]
MTEYVEFALQAKNGDIQAFAKLYEMVYQDMYRFALYTLKNRQDAEDVVSDAVTDAFASIRGLRSAESFKGWIFRILSNKCKRKLREYVNKTMELPDDLCQETDFEEALAVKGAFAKLTNEERLILSMSVFAGYTSREIGQILHKNDNTIRSEKSRALQKMEQFLKES